MNDAYPQLRVWTWDRILLTAVGVALFIGFLGGVVWLAKLLTPARQASCVTEMKPEVCNGKNPH